MTQSVVDIVVRAKGQSELARLQGRLTELEAKVNKLQGQMPKAANGIRAFGRGAAGAAGGVRTLGMAVQAALGPIALLGGAVGALTSAFQTLSTQDFAEAKVRTLGVNSKDLVQELKAVSKELKGQASVVELTGAAYDVASAGFNNAADAAKVLKAASLGATGGFSDINTVGNAATSVLNAYGLAASQATSVVDKFIQTQNDGKIVVAEYAREIGKVASVAAGLKIPLEEVNAVIAQATASGVRSEMAFTGLKTALAQLASGQATERMKELGLNIDATTIEADGLLGTFKKIKESGADMGQVLKLLGTEAGPALAPVLNDLERFEELLDKQKGSAGAAAKAQAEAADTIQGAWKGLTTVIQNFFSDQSALGKALKVTLQVLTYSLQTTADALNFLLGPFMQILDVAIDTGKAIQDYFAPAAEKLESIGQGIVSAWGPIQEIFQNLFVTIGNQISGFGDELQVAFAKPLEWIKEQWGNLTEFFAGIVTKLSEAWGGFTSFMQENFGGAAQQVANTAQGLWSGISNGVQGIVSAIGNAFKAAFDRAWQIIQGFWDSLPSWLKGALSAAGNLVSGITSAVTGALQQTAGAIQQGIAGAGEAGKGKSAPGVSSSSSGGGSGSGSGGGGGGGGGKGRESQLPALQAELQLKQKLFELEKQLQQAKLQDNQTQIQKIQQKQIEAKLDANIAKIAREKITAEEKGVKVQLARLEASRQLEALDFKAAQTEQARVDKLEDLLQGFDREIELANAKTEEAKRLLEIEQKILDLKDQGVIKTEAEAQAYRDRANAAAQAGQNAERRKQAQSDAKALASTLSGGLKNALVTAIKGGDVKQAFAQLAESMGQKFLDMAFRPIEKAFEEMFTGMLSQATDTAQRQVIATQEAATVAQFGVWVQAFQMAVSQLGMGGMSNTLGGSGGGLGMLQNLLGGGTASMFSGGGMDYAGGAVTDAFLPGTSGLGGFFAEGGRPPVGKPSVVGEKGPELFVPSVAGSIIPNDVFAAGRAQLQGSGGASAADAAFSENQAALGVSTAVVQRNAEAVRMQQTLSNSPVKVEVDTVRVADLDVVTVEQFQAGMATTARQARAQVFSDMRNKPSTRSSLGMR